MIRMSTGHMEGNLQLLYVLLTDCYVYLLRKGACRPRLGQSSCSEVEDETATSLSLSPTPSLSCLTCGDENALHRRCH